MIINIQSFRNKSNELAILLNDYNYPNLVIITEHWLTNNELVYLENYTVLSKFCRKNSIHGGTMILANNNKLVNLDFKNIDEYDAMLIEKEFEFSLIFSKKLNLYIVAIYRPPTSNINTFLIKLDVLLSQFQKNSNYILTGDLNINYLDYKNNYTINLKNLLESFGLVMHIDSPTRFSKYSSSIIDYICSNIPLLESTNINAGISDHEAVLCKFFCNFIKQKKIIRKGRIYSKNNYNTFSQLTNNFNWNDIFLSTDPLNLFHTKIVDIFNKDFPIRNIKNKTSKPWITKGIQISSKNVRSLHYIRKFLEPHHPLFLYVNKYKSIYRKVIKYAKNNIL